MKTDQAITLPEIFTTQNLQEAWETVSIKNAAPGIDGVTVDMFAHQSNLHLKKLQQEILNGSYTPQPYISFFKPKKQGGTRELVNSTVRDKIVARAAAIELNRQCDHKLLPQSYAYRPHKGALKAVAAVEKNYASAAYALRADVDQFFDSMDHKVLHQQLTQTATDAEAATFLIRCATADRFDGASMHKTESGIPQGSPLAPILSNLYLHSLDQKLLESNYRFVRYADDILVLASQCDQANGALNLIYEHLNALHLSLSTNKTRVYAIQNGFIFLGFLFTPEGKTACSEARMHLSEKLATPAYADESEFEYSQRLKSIQRGWSNYYGDDGAEEPDVQQPTAEHTPPPPATTDFNAELSAVDQLRMQGLYNEASLRLRRLMNDDNRDLSAPEQKACAQALAAIFTTQGLHGAARRVLQAHGLKLHPAHTESTVYPFGKREIEEWMELFGQAQGAITRQYIDSTGRVGYRPASQKLNPDYLRDHWNTKHTLAIPVYTTPETVHFGLLDLDITKKELNRMDAEAISTLKKQLLDDAIGLVSLARQAGIQAVIEDSGNKGYHVWFFLYDTVSAQLVHRFLRALDHLAGPSPKGTHRECFPNSNTSPLDGTGCRIKLPLGIHRATGNRCAFLNADGSAASPLEQLALVRIRNRARKLKEALQYWTDAQESLPPTQPCNPSETAPQMQQAAATLQPVIEHCAVLRMLEKQAIETRDLTHYERTLLRGILAPLGEAGIQHAHQILSHLTNYDQHLSERLLRAAPSKPLSCQRIREILGSRADLIGCNCTFKPKKSDYAHPLRHAQQATSKKAPNRTTAATPEEAPAPRKAEPPLELLKTYHNLRKQLLSVQQQLKNHCSPNGEWPLDMGTLKCEGPDTELMKWSIEL